MPSILEALLAGAPTHDTTLAGRAVTALESIALSLEILTERDPASLERQALLAGATTPDAPLVETQDYDERYLARVVMAADALQRRTGLEPTPDEVEAELARDPNAYQL